MGGRRILYSDRTSPDGDHRDQHFTGALTRALQGNSSILSPGTRCEADSSRLSVLHVSGSGPRSRSRRRHFCAVQCNVLYCTAVQCSTVKCNAVQYSAVQCSAVQGRAVQCSAVQCSSVKCIVVQYSAVQYGAVLNSTILYSTVLRA